MFYFAHCQERRCRRYEEVGGQVSVDKPAEYPDLGIAVVAFDAEGVAMYAEVRQVCLRPFDNLRLLTISLCVGLVMIRWNIVAVGQPTLDG